MPEKRHVSLFRNGRNQAVPGKHPLLALLETLEPLDDDFPDIEQEPLADEAIF